MDLIDFIINIVIKLFIELIFNILWQIIIEILLWIHLLLVEHIEKLVILSEVLWTLTIVSKVLETAHILKDRYIIGNLAYVQIAKLVDVIRIKLIDLWIELIIVRASLIVSLEECLITSCRLLFLVF